MLKKILLAALIFFLLNFSVLASDDSKLRSSLELPNKHIKVTFIHPGKEDDTLWRPISDLMYAAAKDLNIDLLIFYTKGNYDLMNFLAKSILDQDKPDYLIISNKEAKAAEILSLAADYKVPVILLVDELTNIQTNTLPQKVQDNIITSIVAPYRQIGYLMATSIFRKSMKLEKFKNVFTYRLLAINTEANSPSTREMEVGLLDALEEYPVVVMDEVKYVGDDISKVKTIIKEHMKKYGALHYVWAATDEIALAASDAIEELKKENPNLSVLITSLGWSDNALNALEEDKISVLFGGQFLFGSWAMITIFDYSMAIPVYPFASKKLVLPIITAMNDSNFKKFKDAFPNRNWNIVDYRVFSRYLNPGLSNYNFNINYFYDNAIEQREKLVKKHMQDIKKEIK